MSGASYTFFEPLTVKALKQIIANLPDDLKIQVPSINRTPGEFIDADHVFVDTKEGYVSIDGDIAESFRVGG